MKFSVEQAQTDVLSDMAMLLLHGVTAAHVHHWNTIGPDAYAQHKAIGAFYEKLDDLTDSLIEGCLLDKSKKIAPTRPFFLGETPLALVNYIYDEVAMLRRNTGFPQDSEVQNAVDEIAMLCRHTINKLVRLG
jgi:hypothetical protein